MNYGGNDLGCTYTKEYTTFKVWSPEAEDIRVQLYRTGSDEESGAQMLESYGLKFDKTTGVWTIVVFGDLKNLYYTYFVTVHGRTQETQDVYSVATGVNGKRSMVCDLKATNPEGWEKDRHVFVSAPNDALIWEVHVGDFSGSASSGVRPEYRGKYLAFTERGTKLNGIEDIPTCVDYLLKLGVNYVHLNPVYDFDSVDEAHPEKKQYNWGYDPANYNVPEGSYSTDPFHGDVRIKEFKQMVMALHRAGIGVIMDVVYNHTSSRDSCFNKTAPDYYYRKYGDRFLDSSGCGNVIASEKAMERGNGRGDREGGFRSRRYFCPGTAGDPLPARGCAAPPPGTADAKRKAHPGGLSLLPPRCGGGTPAAGGNGFGIHYGRRLRLPAGYRPFAGYCAGAVPQCAAAHGGAGNTAPGGAKVCSGCK